MTNDHGAAPATHRQPGCVELAGLVIERRTSFLHLDLVSNAANNASRSIYIHAITSRFTDLMALARIASLQ